MTQIIIPAALYDSMLAILIFLALWQAMLVGQGIFRRFVRRPEK